RERRRAAARDRQQVGADRRHLRTRGGRHVGGDLLQQPGRRLVRVFVPAGEHVGDVALRAGGLRGDAGEGLHQRQDVAERLVFVVGGGRGDRQCAENGD